MESPIQLKFFKKLELYQELRSQNEKAAGRDIAWPMEKMMLQWTVWNHHHLGTPLTAKMAFTNRDVIQKEDGWNIQLVEEAMRNLVVRGYAEDSDVDSDGIAFTRLGLLMGEVIDDVEGRGKGTWAAARYVVFIWSIWTIAILGGLTVVFSFAEHLVPVIAFYVSLL